MNYYKLLGVNKEATNEEIKRAYRKMAIKYHPDKNKDSPDATNKFKEVSHAYEILSNKGKRHIYDLTGNEPGLDQSDNQSDSINVDEAFKIFNSMFGDLSSGFGIDPNILSGLMSTVSGSAFSYVVNQQSLKKTDNIYYNLNAKLEDIYHKKIKKLSVERYRKINGTYKKVNIDLKIPLHFHESRFPGEADEMEGYDENGDVIVNVYDKKHPIFRRINDFDLLINHQITLSDLKKGFTFPIQHLSGSEIWIHSKPGAMLNDGIFFQKVIDMGLPDGDSGERGSLFIHYIIDLNQTEKEEDGTKSNLKKDYIIAQKCTIDEIFQ